MGAWLTKGIKDLVKVLHGRAALDERFNAPVGSTNGLGDLIDVLRLDNSLEVILEQLCEVV